MHPLDNPLRIALVCMHTSPYTEPGSGDAGGMNVVVRHQAEALGALGHSVTILTRRSSVGESAPKQVAPGVTLLFLDAGPLVPISKGAHEEFIGAFSIEMSHLEPFHLIHSHHWLSGMAALPIARQWNVPHVQSFHSIAADDSTSLADGERAESPGRMVGESFLARESDSLVAISAAETATITGRLGGRVERTIIVLPGVDSAVFSPAAFDPATPVLGEHGYILVAARLQPLKGLDLAIAAVAAVPSSIRPVLVIAGAASDDYFGYAEELKILAERVGLTDHIQLVGPQSRFELADLFRDARLVLVPSHSETYGLVALESAASGVPVIAAAAGGLREAVVDGVTGLVLDSRDPLIWGDTLTRILTDPHRTRAFSEAAREHALSLDWTRSAEALLSVYRNLLKS